MLREHGSQRPTVFETLNVVHRMRGTKSKFTYNVPSRSQLTPRLPAESSLPTSSTLDGLVSYRSSASASQAQAPPSLTKPDKNAGVQAREKVLEAIAPLRRGRPAPVSLHHATTGPSSPTREKTERKPLELEFNQAEDESWKAARGAVRGHRSGITSPTTWPPPAASTDDAWSFARGSGADADKSKNRDRRKTVQGSVAGLGGFGDSFNDDLASFSTGAAVASASGSPWLTPQPNVKPVATSLRPQETTSRFIAPSKPRDAFDGLGLLSDRTPPPTLGEVQKARTGLSVGATGTDPSSTKLTVPGRGTYQTAPSSPRPTPSPRLSSKAPSPAPPVSTSWRPSHSPLPQLTQTQSNVPKADLTAEQRFPALEVLDRTFPLPSQEKPNTTPSTLPPQPSHSTLTSQRIGSKFTQARESVIIRSVQPPNNTTAPESRDPRPSKHERASASHLPAPSPSRLPRLPSRAPPPKRQTSLATRSLPTAPEPKPEEPPSPAKIMGRPEPQDWLTGPEEDKGIGAGATLVLRDGPSKRSSVIVERAPQIPSPQEAVTVSESRPPPSPSPSPAPTATPTWNQSRADTGKGRFPLPSKSVLASVEPRESAPAPVDSWLPTHRRRDTTSTTSSDDGPEEATGFGPPRLPTTRQQPVRVEAKETGGAGAGAGRRRRSRSKGRQGSVHELVDLWGGKSSGGGSLSPGPKPAPRETEDIPSPSKSFLFPPADQPSKPRSASPQPLTSPSISTDSTKREQPSPTRPSPRHRKQSTNGRDAGPPPSVSAGTATARPRPQSMFLNSPTTAAIKFPVPSPVDSSSTSLAVPPPDARAQRTTRRTSISDMVQRFEALGGNAPSSTSTPTRPPATNADSPAPPPPGPGALLSRSATTHVSPTPRRSYLGGAVGLPGLAADPSKKLPTGLGVSDRPRAEHASPVGLPGLALERKLSASYGRRSPTKIEYAGAGGLEAPARPVPRRTPSPAIPVAGDEAQPPSPERPYHGVGRLIDQWQRKTADAEVPRSPVSRRRGGAVGGTGATASPRRAGVVAGRGTQD
jgi:AP2-associated kinase